MHVHDTLDKTPRTEAQARADRDRRNHLNRCHILAEAYLRDGQRARQAGNLAEDEKIAADLEAKGRAIHFVLRENVRLTKEVVPDLLEAINDVVTQYPLIHGEPVPAWIRNARAAIKKAEDVLAQRGTDGAIDPTRDPDFALRISDFPEEEG